MPPPPPPKNFQKYSPIDHDLFRFDLRRGTNSRGAREDSGRGVQHGDRSRGARDERGVGKVWRAGSEEVFDAIPQTFPPIINHCVSARAAIFLNLFSSLAPPSCGLDVSHRVMRHVRFCFIQCTNFSSELKQQSPKCSSGNDLLRCTEQIPSGFASLSLDHEF